MQQQGDTRLYHLGSGFSNYMLDFFGNLFWDLILVGVAKMGLVVNLDEPTFAEALSEPVHSTKKIDIYIFTRICLERKAMWFENPLLVNFATFVYFFNYNIC